MFKRFLIPSLLCMVFSSAFAGDSIHDMLKGIAEVNHQHITDKSIDFKAFAKEQTPIITVLACSDSRFQKEAFFDKPINNLFVIRNIGNQLPNSPGSIEFGVLHLKTPVLLIVGHSRCGAVDAALSDFSNEPKPIRDELTALHIKKSDTLKEAVLENVHFQVSKAYKNFEQKVKNNELVIIGMIYDIHQEYSKEPGSLILVNLNNEKDPTVLKKDPRLKDIPHLKVGVDKN